MKRVFFFLFRVFFTATAPEPFRTRPAARQTNGNDRRLSAFALPFIFATICLLSSGCSTPPLNAARSDFRAGRLDQAEQRLDPLPENSKDEVLFLMERGTIRQEKGDYEESADDWRKAADTIDELETYSVSRGAASMVSNDRILAFRGKPFERTMLYSFLAKSYIAVSHWDFAGISGRNIIEQLENLNGYPDIAYSRYLAGVCMEIMNDPGNAAIQYNKVNELAPWVAVDPKTGFIFHAPEPAPEADTNAAPTQTPPVFIPETPPPPEDKPFELVCFIGISRPDLIGGGRPYASIYYNDTLLGNSYVLSSTAELMEKTIQRQIILELVKTTARIVVKEAISQTLENYNEFLGGLTRLILYAGEMPDDRQWETLPAILSVARVYCPADISSLRIVFKNASGVPVLTRTIDSPLTRRGRTWFTFCRDIIPEKSE